MKTGSASSLVVGALVTVGLALAAEAPSSPRFDDDFWQLWGDGRAEVAGYELTYPRYGEPRSGTAVTILVTETFDNFERVKADSPRGAGDPFPVLKLNLAQDFSTGIYDYNLMTSTFVALESVNELPAGTTTKVSFSAQEWCGHAYSQVLLDAKEVRLDSHSYFEGEADQRTTLAHPDGGLAEDALLIWARGLAAPRLAPGESRTVPLLVSLETSRLYHRPVTWTRARLSRSAEPRSIEVPAGKFDADVLEVSLEDGRRTWTVHVERQAPHRVLRWSRDDGLRADLVAASRMKYWALNGPGLESALERLGLSPRPSRTP